MRLPQNAAHTSNLQGIGYGVPAEFASRADVPPAYPLAPGNVAWHRNALPGNFEYFASLMTTTP